MTSPTECQHHEGFFRADFLLCCQTVCRRVLAFSHMAVRTDSSTPRSIKHANGFSLFTRCLKFFTSSANPPQMATQAAANKRQEPGLQCYHRSRTSQFDLNGQGRALSLDPPYTLLFYPADLCMCHRHIFFRNFLIFLVLRSIIFRLCCSADHLIRTNLIPPSSLEPDSGYVRISGLGPGPTYNPDPTLTTITKNRARASATDTW